MLTFKTNIQQTICHKRQISHLGHKANSIWVDCSHFVATINMLAEILRKRGEIEIKSK